MSSTRPPQDVLLRPSATSRHPSADGTDWTGTWVGVGFAEQLAEVGAVLPATIGHHGAHVRRTDDGLAAAINARPFGGCMSIPVHCGSTRNVRCPQVSCAFSEDGGVLDGTNDPTGAARAGFVGDGRRTVALPLAQWGSVMFVIVTMTDPPPLPIPADVNLDDGRVVAIGQLQAPANWLVSPMRAASLAAAGLAADLGPSCVDVDVTAVAPNVAVVRRGSATLAVLSRPSGSTRSALVWALSTSDGPCAIDPRSVGRLLSS
ncbi:MAG: hypothetical protein ABW137_25205 [Mycobacterium sp.]